MSNYQQPYPYGASFGVADQSQPAYLAPAYSNQYDQGYDGGHTSQGQRHAVSNYHAYEFNSALPTFSAATTTSNIPPLPTYQGWNQGMAPLPAYTGLSNVSQQNSYTNTSQHNVPYYPAVARPSQSTGQAPKTFEQNDLSEGEFEDGFVTTDTPPIEYGRAKYGENDAIRYISTAKPAVHPDTRNYSPLQIVQSAYNYDLSAQDSYEPQLRDSDSYSPCISPKEDNQYRDGAAQYEGATTTSVDGRPNNEFSGSSYSGSQNMGAHGTQLFTGSNRHGNPNPVEVTPNTTPRPTLNAQEYPSNGKSIAEEKKKALGAILNLWPYDVRYQTYINEGFREDFVKRLFADLRLPLYSKSATGPQKLDSSQQPTQENSRDSSLQRSDNVKPMRNVSNTQPQHVTHHAISDSLRSSKQNSQEVSVPQHFGTSGPMPEKPSAVNEKERTIQAKMEALRKSREERAQKAAAQKNAKPVVTQTQSPPGKEPNLTEVDEDHQSSSAPLPSTLPDQNSNSIVPADLPTQVVKTQSLNPTIPGLFLSSTATSPAPLSIIECTANTQSNTRKRPVAADFDEPLSQLPAVKRPFGQSRSEQSLVIDISEDDADSDEDVAMDLESETNQDSPIQSVKSLQNPRFSVIPNFPIHSNFPTRTLSTPESSAPTTPPISHITSRSSLAGRPEDLQRKESEIELLKKKIAEAEARKKARQTSSGTRTPKLSETIDGECVAANIDTNNNVEASIAMHRLLVIADNQVNVDTQRLLDVEATELSKVEEIKRNEAERIRIRRLQIENELPVVENEYLENQRRLEEMRVEMAQIEANLQKYMEQKNRYTEEMARLGQEAENQLQQQKEKLRDLKKEEAEGDAEPAASSPQGTERELLDQQPKVVTNGEHLRRSLSAQEASLIRVPVDYLTLIAPHSSRLASTETDQMGSAQLIDVIDSDSHVSGLQNPGATIILEATKEDTDTDQALEAALQDAVRAEADLHVDLEEVDMETSYAPDPSQLAPESPITGKQRPSNSLSQRRTSYVTERDSDDYEPPEATPSIEYPFPNQPLLNEGTVTADDSMPGASFVATIQTISDSTSKEPTYEGDDRAILPSQNGSAPSEVLNIFAGPHNPRDADAEQLSKTDASSSSYFTPYESPLRQFRGYRFHPDFQKQIPGGLRSLTYSHKIDPNTEFCRYELAGGVCNDNTCDLLHFKDIGLPDGSILIALGSPEEFTGIRREQFCAGLKTVLNDLRVRKIRDFEAIAAEILAYRKRFLGDASKVLPLEGVSI